MKAHIDMCLSTPPKYALLNVEGYNEGKSANAIARYFKGKQRNFNDERRDQMVLGV